ncbi:MAG TPA: hypothetical protein VMG60_03930 [Burkholderiaceae bacterium]|nr:hypothetical protein [Burkholderiaceae bacterium]
MAAFERATVGLFLWWGANVALMEGPARPVSISRFSVAETAERIERCAQSCGFEVIERIDHSGLAARNGFRLRPTQSLVVDGAFDGAPMRLVVWAAETGRTMVSVDGHVAGARLPSDLEPHWLPRALGPAGGEIRLS